MAIIYPKNGDATASGGTFSVLVPMSSTHGLCKQIFVKATTSTTTFDVYLTDRFSNRFYHTTSITGLLNTLEEIPIYGDFTLTVANASLDETFEYLVSTMTEI